MEGNIFEIQKSLEEEMVYTGIEKFQKQVREAKKKGTESITLHGILLMKKTVAVLSKAIHTYINEEVSKPGRMKALLKLLWGFTQKSPPLYVCNRRACNILFFLL